MLQLGLKILLLVSLLLLGISIIALVSYDRELGRFSYLSTIIDKHNRLESLDAPRIIFLGGSSLAFGLDSPQVEQDLHLPVVNMGLHADLGLRYMLSEVQDELAPGDIVVVSPEYEQFYDWFEGKPILLDTLLMYPQGVRHLSSPQQAITLLVGLPVSIQNLVRARLDGIVFGKTPAVEHPIYRQSGFNVWGDLTSHLDEPSKDVTKDISAFGITLNDNSFITLGQFARQAHAKGARVFILFPAIPRSRYPRVLNQLSEVCKGLQAQTELTLLAAPPDYVFADNSFYDTVYHLNRVGRDKRTKMVIADLRRGLETRPEVSCTAPDQ